MSDKNFSKGRVLKSLGDGVFQILPFQSESCASCGLSGCKNLARDFLAKNAAKLELRPGDVVRLEVSKKTQVLQLAFALGAPILCAALCGLFAPKSDAARAAFVLAGFFAGAAAVALLQKFFFAGGLPEISAKE